MIVVSDTSPISNLLIIGRLELLRNIFGRVIIPTAVASELDVVEKHRRLLESIDWIETVAPKDRSLFDRLRNTLDYGEAEAIALSVELAADVVLIDEKDGRMEADRLGLNVIGLVGVLLEGKRLGYISAVKPEIERLVADARFRLSPSIISNALNAAGEG